jgi:uncharacterized protein with GYD domain
MPRYLFKGSYSGEGVQGILKAGGTSRRAAVEDMVTSLGGSVDAFYFGFGEEDVYAIVDLPDHVSAAAASLTAGGTGLVNIRTVVLLTVEEIDEATKKSVDYRPPGG